MSVHEDPRRAGQASKAGVFDEQAEELRLWRGNDVLAGGRGRDKPLGGPGRDWLLGGPGRDVLLYARRRP